MKQQIKSKIAQPYWLCTYDVKYITTDPQTPTCSELVECKKRTDTVIEGMGEALVQFWDEDGTESWAIYSSTLIRAKLIKKEWIMPPGIQGVVVDLHQDVTEL